MDTVVFTPSAVLDLLCQIQELSDLDIELKEYANRIELTIGDSTYSINTSSVSEVAAEEETIEDIEDVNEIGYETAGEQSVESGLLTALAKTLLLGGMVRLTTKMLKD